MNRVEPAHGSFSATLWARADAAKNRQNFRATAEDVASTAGILLQRDAGFVTTLRTVLTMQPTLTPTQFDGWYRRLERDQRQVGGIGSGVIDVVPARDLVAFQARRNADAAFVRLLGKAITIVAPTGQPQYCLLGSTGTPVPLSGAAARLIQQDWCNPHTFVGSTEASALWAAASGDRLLVNTIDVAWMRTTIFEIPFYRRGAPLTTAAERTASTRGWVLSSFDVAALLHEAVGGRHGLSLIVRYDNPDGRRVTVAAVGRAGGALTHTTVMSFDGRWTITVGGAPVASGMSSTVQGVLIAAGGVVVTLLLSLLILTLSRSRERALQMVAEKTGQLRHQALHDSLTGLPTASWPSTARSRCWPVPAAPGNPSPCSTSMWTASSTSTTPSATPWATRSCRRSRRAWTRWCARVTPRPGSPATSSWCCWRPARWTPDPSWWPSASWTCCASPMTCAMRSAAP